MTVPYFLAPAEGPGPGVVVVMEGTGITPQLLRVCERLAAEGYTAVAPDLYWRFGGSDPERQAEHVSTLRHKDGRDDIRACVAVLRAMGAPKVGITGFCLGGGLAYRAAVSDVDVDAAVGFYGGGVAQHLGDEPHCPLLMFWGGRDEWIPAADIEAVEQHHPGVSVVYPEAEHGFFRDGSKNYDEAAATDAWKRMLAFFGEHLR